MGDLAFSYFWDFLGVAPDPTRGPLGTTPGDGLVSSVPGELGSDDDREAPAGARKSSLSKCSPGTHVCASPGRELLLVGPSRLVLSTLRRPSGHLPSQAASTLFCKFFPSLCHHLEVAWKKWSHPLSTRSKDRPSRVGREVGAQRAFVNADSQACR